MGPAEGTLMSRVWVGSTLVLLTQTGIADINMDLKPDVCQLGSSSGFKIVPFLPQTETFSK